MENIKRKSVIVNNHEMTYIELGETGTGKDIIISHGALFNANAMLDYGKAWAKDNHVILIDMPGHYRKDESDATSFKDLVATVKFFIDELTSTGVITQKPIFQGWSLGGSLTLGLAIEYPDLLSGIAMISSDCSWGESGISGFDTEEATLGILTYLIQTCQSEGVSDEKVAQLISELPETYANAYSCRNDLELVKGVAYEDRLEELELPVAIICGDKDLLTTETRQLALARRIKNSSVSILKGCNHTIVMEKPEVVAEFTRGVLL